MFKTISCTKQPLELVLASLEFKISKTGVGPNFKMSATLVYLNTISRWENTK